MQRIDLEGELRLQEQHITNALKDNIVLKQQLAQPNWDDRALPKAELRHLG
jgi:hypothetical protein